MPTIYLLNIIYSYLINIFQLNHTWSDFTSHQKWLMFTNALLSDLMDADIFNKSLHFSDNKYVIVTGLVLCAVETFYCDDVDSTACARMASLRPDMCNDTCYASVCQRQCGKCRKYKQFYEHMICLNICLC